MADLLNNEQAQRKLKSREARRVQIYKDSVDYMMSDRRGRHFMYELIFHKLGLQVAYLAADSGIYRHEGKRTEAVKLGDEIQQTHPDEYVLMIMERMEYLKNDKAVHDAATETGEAE